MSASSPGRSISTPRPFPEWASPVAVVDVGRQLGAERADLWSCAFRHEPHRVAGLSLDVAGRQSFALGCASILVAFEAPLTCIWQLLEHEFFVIFGPQSALEAVPRHQAGPDPLADRIAGDGLGDLEVAPVLADGHAVAGIDPAGGFVCIDDTGKGAVVAASASARLVPQSLDLAQFLARRDGSAGSAAALS